jgi:hypothetical protein
VKIIPCQPASHQSTQFEKDLFTYISILREFAGGRLRVTMAIPVSSSMFVWTQSSDDEENVLPANSNEGFGAVALDILARRPEDARTSFIIVLCVDFWSDTDGRRWTKVSWSWLVMIDGDVLIVDALLRLFSGYTPSPLCDKDSFLHWNYSTVLYCTLLYCTVRRSKRPKTPFKDRCFATTTSEYDFNNILN